MGDKGVKERGKYEKIDRKERKKRERMDRR